MLTGELQSLLFELDTLQRALSATPGNAELRGQLAKLEGMVQRSLAAQLRAVMAPRVREEHDGSSPNEATINYTLSDCGTHYTITPRCYFDTRGKKAKVKVDPATGRMSVRPARPPEKDYLNKYGVTKFIGGGYFCLPKKCDVNATPTIRHVGNNGQLLVIDMPKLAEFHTKPKFIDHC